MDAKNQGAPEPGAYEGVPTDVAQRLWDAVEGGNVFLLFQAITDAVLARFKNPILEDDADTSPVSPTAIEVVEATLIANALADDDRAKAVADFAQAALAHFPLTEEARAHLLATIEDVISLVAIEHGVDDELDQDDGDDDDGDDEEDEVLDNRCTDLLERYSDRGLTDMLQEDPIDADNEMYLSTYFGTPRDDSEDARARTVRRYLAFCVGNGVDPDIEELRADPAFATLDSDAFQRVLHAAQQQGCPLLPEPFPALEPDVLPDDMFDADEFNPGDLDHDAEPVEEVCSRELTMEEFLNELHLVVISTLSQITRLITAPDASRDDVVYCVTNFAAASARRYASFHVTGPWCEATFTAELERHVHEKLNALLGTPSDEDA